MLDGWRAPGAQGWASAPLGHEPLAMSLESSAMNHAATKLSRYYVGYQAIRLFVREPTFWYLLKPAGPVHGSYDSMWYLGSLRSSSNHPEPETELHICLRKVVVVLRSLVGRSHLIEGRPSRNSFIVVLRYSIFLFSRRRLCFCEFVHPFPITICLKVRFHNNLVFYTIPFELSIHRFTMYPHSELFVSTLYL